MEWHPEDSRGWPTTEQRLLVRAAVLEGDEALEAWREWRAGNDLASVDAASFFLLPQLFRNLGRCGLTGPDLAALGGVYRYTWTRNQVLFRGLASAIASLDRAGVEPLVFKGAALALFHYGDPGIRMMSDADLLIRERDIPVTLAALGADGWSVLGRVPPSLLRPFRKELSIRHARWRPMDLHWRFLLDPGFKGLEDGYRERSLRCEIQEVRARIPCPEDALLTTLYDSRRPGSQGVARWVVDVAAITHGGARATDWAALIERAARSGLLLPVRDTLGYLHREFPGLVPADAVRAAADRSASRENLLGYERLTAHLPAFARSTLRAALAARWRYCVRLSRDRALEPRVPAFARFFLLIGWLAWRNPGRLIRRLVGKPRRRVPVDGDSAFNAQGLAELVRPSDPPPVGDAAHPPSPEHRPAAPRRDA